MTSIISSNHYVAKLEINLHIINFCHDYYVLCDTEITVQKGQLFPTTAFVLRRIKHKTASESQRQSHSGSGRANLEAH